MIRISMAGASAALGVVLLIVGAAHAVSPAEKCEAAKLKVAGKYDFCRLKAEATAAKSGGMRDFSKCDPIFSGKWSQAETKANGMCPSNGDEAAMQSFITQHTDALAAALGGGTLPQGVLTCNTNLSTCNADLAACEAKIGVLKTGQTTAYGTGSDGDLQKGVSRSYTDNGDGTVTDNTTGLMWEKKSYDGSIHDFNNSYTWSGPSFGTTNIMDGTITSSLLATINAGGGFAGHTDWRIPNRFELESLLNFQNVSPAVDSAFNMNCMAGCTVTMCSCTQPSVVLPYWSSTTNGATFDVAFLVRFSNGEAVNGVDKSASYPVRAVRNTP
jgi:hypothetical protein